eukprot:PhM_4_TR13931/c0_g1_i1/m.33519
MIAEICTLSRDELRYLRKEIRTAGGEVGRAEFVTIFRSIISSRGVDVEERELNVLFMQIDANSGGTVDWEELTSYFLLASTLESDNATNKDKVRVIVQPEDLSWRTLALPHKSVRHTDNPDYCFWFAQSSLLVTASSVAAELKAWKSPMLHHYRTPFVGKNIAITNAVRLPQYYVAVACTDRTISIFDTTRTMDLVATYTLRPETFPDTTSTSSRRPFTASVSGALQRKNLGLVQFVPNHLNHLVVPDELPLTPLRTTVLVNALCVGYVRGWMVVGCDDGTLKPFDIVGRWRDPIRLPHIVIGGTDIGVTSVMDLPEVDSVMVGCSDGSLVCLNRTYMHNVYQTTVHRQDISKLVWSAEHGVLLSLAKDMSIAAWKPPSSRPILRTDTPVDHVDACFIPSSYFIAVLLSNGHIHMYDVRTLCVTDVIISCSSVVKPTCVLFAPRYKELWAIGSGVHRVHLAWIEKGSDDAQDLNPSLASITVINCIFARAVEMLVVAEEHKIYVVDLRTEAMTCTIPIADGVSGLSLDDSEQKLVVGTLSGSVVLYNFIVGNQVQTCVPRINSPEEVTCVLGCIQEIPYTQGIVVVGYKTRVEVYPNTEDDELTSSRVFDLTQLGDVLSLCFIPKATLIVGGSKGMFLLRLEEATSRGVYYPTTPVGSKMAGCVSVSRRQGAVVDVPPQSLAASSGATTTDLGFNANEDDIAIESMVTLGRARCVLMARTDGYVCTFDLRHLEFAAYLGVSVVQSEPLFSIALSNDAHTLCCGDGFGYVHIFDVSTVTSADSLSNALRLGMVRGHDGTVNNITFSSSNQIVSSGTDGRIVFYTDLGDIVDVQSVSSLVQTKKMPFPPPPDVSRVFDELRFAWLLDNVHQSPEVMLDVAAGLDIFAPDTLVEENVEDCISRLAIMHSPPKDQESTSIHSEGMQDHILSSPQESVLSRNDSATLGTPALVHTNSGVSAGTTSRASTMLRFQRMMSRLPTHVFAKHDRLPQKHVVEPKHNVPFNSVAPRPPSTSTYHYSVVESINNFTRVPSPDVELKPPSRTKTTDAVPLGDKKAAGVKPRYTRTHLLRGVKYRGGPLLPDTPVQRKLGQFHQGRINFSKYERPQQWYDIVDAPWQHEHQNLERSHGHEDNEQHHVKPQKEHCPTNGATPISNFWDSGVISSRRPATARRPAREPSPSYSRLAASPRASPFRPYPTPHRPAPTPRMSTAAMMSPQAVQILEDHHKTKGKYRAPRRVFSEVPVHDVRRTLL